MILSYHRQCFDGFKPKTPAAAYHALRQGLVPVEAFAYQAVCVRPLMEEPVSLEEIDRILARPRHDLRTRFLLRNVLSRLINDSDMEVALFAAESLNILESRATDELERWKERLKEKEEFEAIRGLARGYYELGILNEGSMRDFYLEESLGYYGRLGDADRMGITDTVSLFRVFIELGKRKEAERLIAAARKVDEGNPDLLFCIMELAFLKKDFLRLHAYLQPLADRRHSLSHSFEELFNTWFGDDEGKEERIAEEYLEELEVLGEGDGS